MAKSDPNAPKKFQDCLKLYKDCEVPKQHTFSANQYPMKRRKYFRRNNQTTTTVEEDETTTPVNVNDLVTKYVKQEE